MPRILPLVGIAVGGVLAVNALAGAKDLPGLLSGAKAFAEEAAKPAKGQKPAATTGEAANAAAKAPMTAVSKAPVCAPTAAELAKEAGLSPAELQVLQSLGERRGQLEAREEQLNTQLALMAAAEAKLDAKVKTLNALKQDISGLVTAADGAQAAEIDRMVKVFEGMKPKDAAPRLVLLDDAVRLPIAAKMKERSLSAILAQMPPAEAKRLTEALAKRFTQARNIAANAAASADQAASQTAPAAAQQAAAKPAPAKAAPRKAPAKQAQAAPRKTAPPSAQAAATPASPAAAGAAPAAAPAAAAPAAPSAG